MKPRKITVIYALPILGLLAFSSCKKNNLLNLTPPTSLSDASYWHSVSDLQGYLNNLYNSDYIFPHYDGYGNLGIYSIDENSDNMVPLFVNSQLNGENTVSGTSTYANYSLIWDVNYFLANCYRVNASASEIAPYVGQAYFFRAMLYFKALQAVGGVPWINQPVNINDTALLNTPRMPRNILVDSIISDLDKAITDLPTKSMAPPMQLYKEYAEGYKARVCLYEGTWEKYHEGDPFGVPGQNGTQYLQLAAEAADAVITSGIFHLDNVGVPDGYFQLFNQPDYSNSNEIMFWGAYSQQDGIVNVMQNYYQFGSAGSEATGLSKSLIDAYLCTDGKPISISPLYKGDDSMSRIIENRDPRLRQMIFIYGDTVISNQPGSNPVKLFEYPAFNTGGTPCTTGYQIKKGLSTDFYQDPHNGPGGTDGIIYMRYAEILLIYAEAKAELGTITQQDIDETINKLRGRVGMPPLELNNIPIDPDDPFPNLPPIVQAVRRARRVELACEGFRFNDICRWAAAPQLILNKQPLGAKVEQFLTVPLDGGPLKVGQNIFTNAQGYMIPYAQNSAMANGYQFNINRDYLLPIPLQEITVNPKIEQNPGWQ